MEDEGIEGIDITLVQAVYGQKVVPVHYTILKYSVLLAQLSAHTAWISCTYLSQFPRQYSSYHIYWNICENF